jgi:hypothetical protein
METTETFSQSTQAARLDTQSEIRTPWDYAQYRLTMLRRSRAVQIEFSLVVGLFLVLFGPAFLYWWQRWTLETSPQGYAVGVLPMLLLWLWLNRYRVLLPELDSLNERFTERSVIRFLLEEEPEPVKRLRWPLALACLWTPLAFWMGDATFTALSFVLMVIGLVGFRFGTIALRLNLFPLTILATLIPIPGVMLDYIASKLQIFFFKVTLHLLQILNANAEMPPESNPIVMLGQPRYNMFAGQVGVGLTEVGLFLLLTLGFLSLLACPFRFKITGFLIALVWGAALVMLRLALIAYVGSLNDPETTTSLIPWTSWLLPVVGLAGQILFMRGLKCREYHEWVSLSWRRSAS